MATLDALKRALRQKATSPTQPLSDEQYSAGFDILLQGPGWKTYQDFIFPQLSQVLTPLFNSRIRISVLEIGPGPKSVLGYLPDDQRRKINKYAAFEPNGSYATELQEWLETKSPLPCLESLPDIHRVPFTLDSTVTDANDGQEKFDVVLFCHSMYGMIPKRNFIERALEMLAVQPEGGVVVVFHRDGVDFDGLVCHKTASFPSGTVRVADNDKMLNSFSSFIAGFVMQDKDADEAVHAEWRKVCRDLGRRQEAHPGHLFFGAPEVMIAFNHHATMLPELTAQVLLAKEDRTVKNWEARVHRPASILRPTKIQHVQKCVQWALKHRVGLTVIGGSHSGHCIWPNVVAIDMEAFDQVHVQAPTDNGTDPDFHSGSLIIAGAGCKTGDILRAAMAAGLTVPLGARPSVGAGLWLQGGLGHLARLHGLACDSIVGFIMVSVDSAQILCVGHVPNEYWPTSGVRPENEAELLWAMKGAGTNFGIVTSVIFKAYPAPVYTVRNWIVSLDDEFEARRRLTEFDKLIASNLPRNCSADAYLYCDAGRLQFGITTIEAGTTKSVSDIPTVIDTILGPECNLKVVDSVGLFDTEMYVAGMHGGHGGGKTSSFKRCLFLKHIGAADVAAILVAAVESRPTTLCYLHLLQGGGAVADVVPNATAFGCRDWDFACVVTGVWPRHHDGTETAQAAIEWVYHVARTLLPLASGAYGADLGPDPRDADLAEKAFGPNRPRLARLKRSADPCKVLAYACPLPEAPMGQKLMVLVTGEHGAGKDYCADIWASVFNTASPNTPKARVASISDVTKREYAAATGADLDALLQNRAYKEEHRPALTAFFQEQVRQRSRLPEEHFLNVVHGAVDVDVLLITGMRDEAPVAALSHLVPDSRVLEVRVKSREETKRARGGCQIGDGVVNQKNKDGINGTNGRLDSTVSDWSPNLIFYNDTPGSEIAKEYGQRRLLPFLSEDMQQLANMVRSVPDFPRSGIEFRHLLDISQQPGGLKLCVSLFRSHFAGDWSKIGAVVCCEAGGFIFASALASQIDLPLVLIREAGKLPPPVVSVVKRPSHISHSTPNSSREKKMEMERDAIRRGASVLVVDDVLATGETLCAVLQLLSEAGVSADHISVMVVAEFPVHRGRGLMRRCGFGRVSIQSLLVFGGA
ncbi:Adenine phosphoribosyl transferase [Trichoderma simmonsii]|uniref:Adenine phosphoribosyl transferase n=1 Tax=Trichoderma simmonsii TaxID=1491479 RepID=A0A8G0L649_9HYPO|nr:Adenine phosphoribosyl transferase [Trichoderma simmonsii]